MPRTQQRFGQVHFERHSRGCRYVGLDIPGLVCSGRYGGARTRQFALARQIPSVAVNHFTRPVCRRRNHYPVHCVRSLYHPGNSAGHHRRLSSGGHGGCRGVVIPHSQTTSTQGTNDRARIRCDYSISTSASLCATRHSTLKDPFATQPRKQFGNHGAVVRYNGTCGAGNGPEFLDITGSDKFSTVTVNVHSRRDGRK